MKNIIKSIGGLLLGLALLNAETTLAQSNGKLLDHQLRLSLDIFVAKTAQFNKDLTDYGLKQNDKFAVPSALPAPGGELSLTYYKHIKNNFGVHAGIGLGILPFYYRYHFNKPETVLPLESLESYGNKLSIIEYDNLMLNFPVSVQKIVSVSEHRFFNMEIGFKMNYFYLQNATSTGFGAVSSFDNTVDLESFELNLNSPETRWLHSYFMKIGLIQLQDGGNTLNYNLVFHFSFSDVGAGYYKASQNNEEHIGLVSQNMNYIGFEIAYGFGLGK